MPSREQERLGLERSLELRRKRAALKAALKTRDITFSQAIEVAEAQGMAVMDLLLALPSIGRVKAERMLAFAGIPVKNTVGKCGPRQRAALLDIIMERW